MALQERGELLAATAAFGRALAAPVSDTWTSKGRVDAFVNLGVTLQYQGRVTEAAQFYRAAFNESDSTDVDALLNLGSVLRILGKTDEARRAFLWAVKLSPFSLDSWLLGANLYAELGEIGELETVFETVLTAVPDSVPRPAALVQLYAYVSGDGACKQAATALLRAVVRREGPPELVARLLLGRSLSSCGEDGAAATEYRGLRAALDGPLNASLSTFYRLNKLSLFAASTFADKATFATRMGQIPDALRSLPTTFVLPDDYDELVAADKQRRSSWVIKPAYGSGGLGLRIVANLSSVEEGQAGFVVQRYIDSPLLLDGRKFSVRLYAAVTSVVPLRVHLYTNGYALLCSTPYQPGPAHFDDGSMQFSNAARAALEPTYAAQVAEPASSGGMEVVGVGQRRTVAWLSQHAAAHNIDFNAVWAKMRSAVIHAVLATEGPLAASWTKLAEGGGGAGARQRFLLPKILGVDFQLDDEWGVHLLELNPQPDIREPEPLKLRLVRDALLLATPAEQEPEPASAQPAGEAGAAEAEAEAARASATQWEPLFPWGLSHEELAPLLAHFALAGHSADVARTCTARAVASGQAGRKAW